jgi:two-component system response regulator AtoC
LEALVNQGRMLEDFLPRLGWFRVTIPPLRERRDDIPGLVAYIVERSAHQCGYERGEAPSVHPVLMEALVAAEWKYNLRELEGVVKRLMVEGRRAPQLTIGLCAGDLAYLARPVAKHRRRGERVAEIRAAMEACGSIEETAAALGISRTTVWRHRSAVETGDETSVRAVDPEDARLGNRQA